jgi:short-subunit dehydrogenase
MVMVETKVALISGCSSGIGRELAETLASRNYVVYATARRLESLKNLQHPRIIPEVLDVTSEEQIQTIMLKILGDQGRLDVLVNNAGYGLMGPVVELDLQDVRRQFETNVYGAIALSQQAARIMIRQRSGAIVNIGSVSGVVTSPFSGAYCASKAALHAISDALRLELAAFHIRVLTVQPGGIRSRFGDNASRTIRKPAPDSVFASLGEVIQNRAALSQENAVPASVLVDEMVAWIEGSSKRTVLRAGRWSRLLPFLQRWLPGAWRDRVIEKQFGLAAFRQRLDRERD